MGFEIKVSANLLVIPKICCCCAEQVGSLSYQARATKTKGKRVIRTQTKSWDFLICDDCSRWINQTAWARTIVKIAVVLFLIGLYFLSTDQTEVGIGIASIFGILCWAWLQARKKGREIMPHPNCRPEPVEYFGWHGTVHSFRFSNPTYVEMFKQGNIKKLIA